MIKRTENERKLELTLFPDGVLNSTYADAVLKDLTDAKGDIWCTVFLDLSGVPLVSSEGYAMLLRAQEEYCATGKKLVLRNPVKRVDTGLAWTGINKVISVEKEAEA